MPTTFSISSNAKLTSYSADAASQRASELYLIDPNITAVQHPNLGSPAYLMMRGQATSRSSPAPPAHVAHTHHAHRQAAGPATRNISSVDHHLRHNIRREFGLFCIC